MLLTIHTSGIQATGSLKEYIERRVSFALDRFSETIHSVSVTLQDTNGPRGGVDQMCRIRVQLVGQRKPIVAETTHEALRAAIDVAADCAGRSVARALDRKSDIKRERHELQLELEAMAQEARMTLETQEISM